MHIIEYVGLFSILIVIAGYINHNFIKLPDTIGVTLVGAILAAILGVFSTTFPDISASASNFVSLIDFNQLMFQGFLPLLLFAGSLHVNISSIRKHWVIILVLSTIGVIISTAIIGFALHYALALVSVNVPIVYCLIFGALISPTDPIAVLDTLKSAGVPPALQAKITGESLFNDGTSVSLFISLIAGLSVAASSSAIPISMSGLSITLLTQLVGGVIAGLVLGGLAYWLLKGINSHPIEILATIAVASGGYAVAERLHVSAPIALVVAGLVIGNKGAYCAMSDESREHLFNFWKLVDEVLTLALFGLIGLLLLAISGGPQHWIIALVAIPVVIIARFTSVGIPFFILNRKIKAGRHTTKLLTWGGLRGGISIAMALSIPESPYKAPIVIATFAVVLFSLFVQATTLKPLYTHLSTKGAS